MTPVAAPGRPECARPRGGAARRGPRRAAGPEEESDGAREEGPRQARSGAGGGVPARAAPVATACRLGAPPRSALPSRSSLARAGETAQAPSFPVREYAVPAGSHPHDVAPAARRRRLVHGAGERRARLARPGTGRTRHVPLGDGSAPHGVIVGPDGAPWITDGGLNAIVRVDPRTRAVRLPAARGTGYANLNTAVFDRARRALVHGPERDLRPPRTRATGAMRVFAGAARPGPYGITATPRGDVYYASLAGSHIGAHRRRAPAGDRAPAADARPGRAPRLVGLARPDLGERVERGQGSAVRPGDAAAGASGGSRAPRRRPTRSTSTAATRLADATSAATRSSASTRATERFTQLPAPDRRRGRAPAPRTPRRGLGRRVGARPARRRAHGLAATPLVGIALKARL